MHPLQLARPGIEGNHRAAGSGRGVEHAADHERRPFQLELWTGAEVVGLEAPGHFELVEIGGVDLRKRRVFACRGRRRCSAATPRSVCWAARAAWPRGPADIHANASATHIRAIRCLGRDIGTPLSDRTGCLSGVDPGPRGTRPQYTHRAGSFLDLPAVEAHNFWRYYLYGPPNPGNGNTCPSQRSE